jgi:flagellar basal body-associated protein FliL
MKTKSFFIATLLVVAAVAAVVVSCKKEKQEPSSNNTEQTVQSADNMDEYLISFKKILFFQLSHSLKQKTLYLQVYF